jgi:hypothetical protein
MFREAGNSSDICKNLPFSLKTVWLVSWADIREHISRSTPPIDNGQNLKKVFLIAKARNLLVPVVCSWSAWDKNTDRK